LTLQAKQLKKRDNNIKEVVLRLCCFKEKNKNLFNNSY